MPKFLHTFSSCLFSFLKGVIIDVATIFLSPSSNILFIKFASVPAGLKSIILHTFFARSVLNASGKCILFLIMSHKNSGLNDEISFPLVHEIISIPFPVSIFVNAK